MTALGDIVQRLNIYSYCCIWHQSYAQQQFKLIIDSISGKDTDTVGGIWSACEQVPALSRGHWPVIHTPKKSPVKRNTCTIEWKHGQIPHLVFHCVKIVNLDLHCDFWKNSSEWNTNKSMWLFIDIWHSKGIRWIWGWENLWKQIYTVCVMILFQ